jgi:serine/threonine protein kinase
MSLAPGTRLGPYQITARIGTGGMGEVYRARDTRLNRDVAIKVLPSELARDPDRLARFEREARVLASLNHPHIATIYGLEDSPEGKALAMELVDGATRQSTVLSTSHRKDRIRRHRHFYIQPMNFRQAADSHIHGG